MMDLETILCIWVQVFSHHPPPKLGLHGTIDDCPILQCVWPCMAAFKTMEIMDNDGINLDEH